MFQHCIYIN